MAGGDIGGPAIRNRPPDIDDYGDVVRPIGPIGPVIPEPATDSVIASFAVNLAPQVFLPAASIATRLGFSIFNQSEQDTLYVKASSHGPAVSTTFFTVKIRPGGYYEDPYHYVGEVTGVWGTNIDPNTIALVDEYKP